MEKQKQPETRHIVYGDVVTESEVTENPSEQIDLEKEKPEDKKENDA